MKRRSDEYLPLTRNRPKEDALVEDEAGVEQLNR